MDIYRQVFSAFFYFRAEDGGEDGVQYLESVGQEDAWNWKYPLVVPNEVRRDEVQAKLGKAWIYPKP